ncbi:hypothetical protein [Streptomyces noursei]|uniref:Uncharacterized protein n=2 Tax=Streptomyces noursei TaxID=1971 RepID=A0A401R0N6_STRNR|nr:hypothetical protein [Streptomyces noursei]UWS72267.1 hypothetical protein N1H47_13950 [Streptomyces noursei]GCB91174.1 hypothetical protein SALB_03889 [Streptomyces noursei]
MSNTGDQNPPFAGDQNAPFSAPQPPAYGPTPAPPPPVPAQQNPYAQPGPQGAPPGTPPAPPQGPGGYGYPAPAGAYGAAPTGAPGAAPSRGVSGWLWAVGGAVAATAIGASVMFATGAFSSEPHPVLKGYAFRDDLCSVTSLMPFENAHYKTKPSAGTGSTGSSGPSSPPNPQHSGSRMGSMDSMWCNVSLTPEGAGTTDYSSSWVYSAATLHKKTDPAPEFADLYRAYETQQTSTTYKVEPVPGIGDEAFLVTRNDSGALNSSYVILAVRDGWMTYQTTWSSYTTSSSTVKPPGPAEIATMLESSARETLSRLHD